MAKDTGKKLADMMYGQPFDVPTPENLRLGQKLIEQQVREKAARDAKLTPLDKAKAAYEAAKMMGSAAVAGLGSIPTRIAYGPEAAENYIANRISIPTTEKGLDYVENVGNFLEQLETKYKLPPILPEAMVLQNLTGPATKQAIRASKKKATQAAEKAVRFSNNPDVMQLEMAAGGGVLSKLAKLARAPAKTKQEIEAIAERIAPQVTGEYVRKKPGSAVTVADKTKKQFEREKNLPVDVRAIKEERIPQPVDIEKLKGEVMIGIPGDPTITGKTLHSVGDVRLESPAPQHGGPLYGLYHDDDHFWASGLGAARRVQNLAKEAGEQYDAPVIGKYIMMGPESINYAQHFADANLQAIDLSKMTKKQIEGFNKIIRQGSPASGPRPSFPGIEDKESAYLHMAMDPELRKHFNALMQQNTVTEAFNLPSGQDIRFAITEGPLRDLETGVTGYSMGRMRPDIPSSELKLSEHPTYSHDIPGEFLGQSKYPIPYELSFPDTLKSIRENPKQAGHEFGSLKMVGPRQTIDQQLIDEIKAYEERMKALTGKKKGGAVRKAAGGEITADDLILEERKL